MNRGFWLILMASLLVNLARGEELIPDTCWFEAPPDMEHLVEPNDPGDNPFSMESKAIEFQSGNQPGNFCDISFSIRFVGVTIGQGKTSTVSPVSDEQLKVLMVSGTNRGKTNVLKIEDATGAP
jgi:hypothetical protein